MIFCHILSLQMKRVRARPHGIRCVSYVLSPYHTFQGSHTSVRQQRDKAESCENSHQWAAWLRMLLGKMVSPQLKICRKTVTSFMQFRVSSSSFILWNLKLEQSCQVIMSTAEMWFKLVPPTMFLHVASPHSSTDKKCVILSRILKITVCDKLKQFRTIFTISYHLPIPDCKTMCCCHILSTTLIKMIIARHAKRMANGYVSRHAAGWKLHVF